MNLHEGSGWYNPEWKNEMENPKRFGQSVTFDAGTYLAPNGEKKISLEEWALRVIGRVNPQIGQTPLPIQSK